MSTDSPKPASFLQKPWIWVGLFFAVFLVAGLLTYKDYGISWDEKVNRGNGGVTAKYILQRISPGYVAAHPELADVPDLHTYQDRDYGVAFELFLVMAEKAAGVQENTAELFYLRHLLTFLFFFVSVFFFFLLVRDRFDCWKWGILGAALLALSPRIFADSFYNSKDLVFLSAFIIGLYFLFRFLETRTVGSAILFGLTAAIATDIRILGIFLPFFGGGAMVWELITARGQREETIAGIRALLTMCIAWFAFTVILWPFLWENPVGNFLYALKSMSKFRWEGKVLFMGSLYNGNELPFYYLPVWIAISSPLLVVLTLPLGIFTIVKDAVANKLKLWKDNEGRRDVITLALFLAPVMATIVLGSTLYSGWRQMFFIYPMLLLVSIAGLRKVRDLFAKYEWKNYVPGVLGWIQGLWLIWILFSMHPYGNVYFNILAGGSPENKFEMDYWGLAYRDGLEYVAATDKADTLYLKVESYPGKTNLSMLSAADQARVQYVESGDSAAWYLGAKPLAGYENAKEMFSVEPSGSKILRVWKLK